MAWEEVTILGDARFWLVFTVLTIALYKILPKKALHYLYFNVVPAAAIATAFSEALKLIVRSPRPCAGIPWCPDEFSFPSGHAVVAFAVFTSIYLGIGKKEKKHLAIFIIPALVAVSRVALGVHRVEDVIAGGIIGIAFAFGYSKAYERFWPKK